MKNLQRGVFIAVIFSALAIFLALLVLPREEVATPLIGQTPRPPAPAGQSVSAVLPQASPPPPLGAGMMPKAPTQALWPEPSTVWGKPLSQQLRLASSEEAPKKGRSAPFDPKTLLDLSKLNAGSTISIPLFGGVKVSGVVNLRENDEGWTRIGGTLTEGTEGSFTVASNGKTVGATILLPKEGIAYEVAEQRDGQILVQEKPIQEVVCQPMPRDNSPKRMRTAAAATAPPILSSRPTATAVIYLDFDGETVSNPSWNGGRTIFAAHPEFTSTEVTEIWRRVKEDYLPFNIDITTNRARYTNAPVGRRMHCIITPTDTAQPGSGGVAYLFSFARAGMGQFNSTIPCWVYNLGVVACAETISHEVGHTLGLQHDGRTSPIEEYYGGHGSGDVGWGPIMGATFSKALSQWSKGEYSNASQRQDDIAIITNSENAFGFTTDEAGGTMLAAAALNSPGGTISQPGVIHNQQDIDFYVFSCGAGSLNITASPAAVGANLDIRMELQNSNAQVLATSNPDLAINASISTTVTAGTYYVKVQGTGRSSPTLSGYSSYGSIGEYTLRGTIPVTTQAPSITSSGVASGSRGQAFLYQIVASNSPTSYRVTGTLPPGLSLNTTTGRIAGTPTADGVFDVTLGATNSIGTGSKALRITIITRTLADAVDATAFAWSTTGSPGWKPQTATTFDGVDAAQSGAITHNSSTVLLTRVNGPGTVTFRWKTDSELTYDLLDFTIGTTSKATLSGRTEWLEQSFSIPNGAQDLKWTYRKDASVSSGLDAGWVDSVRITINLVPQILSSGTASGSVGSPFTYDILASNEPTSFSVVGTLPPGLTFNSSLRRISGTPTTAGSYTVSLRAGNASGTGSKDLTITVVSTSITLAQALDGSGLTWTTGGNGNWTGQSAVTFDNIDAARSASITNLQQTYIRTSVVGPATLTFRWRVDSEEGYDFLNFSMDGTLIARISGLQNWAGRTLEIPSGTHVLQWTYQKDDTLAMGLDAGWVDTVSVVKKTSTVLALSGNLAFGNVPVGSKVEMPLTISNKGTEAFVVDNIACPTGFSGNFSGSIAAGASRTVLIAFTPTATISYSGTLKVNSNAASGTNTLAVSGTGTTTTAIPGNDNFASAFVLNGTNDVVVGRTNRNATKQSGEPNHAGNTGGRSVWWKWVAPSAAPVRINTLGSDFDTILAVYEGTAVGSLTAKASNDDTGTIVQSALGFTPVAGRTYWIAVDGYNGVFGAIKLTLTTP